MTTSVAPMTELAVLPRVRRAQGTALVEPLLLQAGVDPAQFVHAEPVRGRPQLLVYFASRSRARSVKRRLASTLPPGWELRERVLHKEDWLTKWQTAYRITPMGKRFAVVPVWRQKEFRGRRIPVLIHPHASFGSGTHDTTRFIAALMERADGRFKSFLDIGTGTGILMVVAARLGALNIAGSDIDPEALVTARENLERNGVRGRLLRGDILRKAPAGRYGLVAANLFSSVLVQARPALVRAVEPGGYLAVSGIERVKLAWFLKAFRDPALRRLATLKSRRWAAVLYKKTGRTQGL